MMMMVSVNLTACSTVSRVRLNDPVLRVAIAAESVPQGSYMRLQRSLVESNAFVVVDRAAGFRAIDKEQRLQHKTSRFGKDEKYADWGSLYGVGGIIVGSQQCEIRNAYNGSHYYRCLENLSLIDVTTGEAIAVSEKQVEVPGTIDSPDWTEAVNQLIESYPKVFADNKNIHQTISYSGSLQDFRQSLALKQEHNRKPASDDLSDDDQDDSSNE